MPLDYRFTCGECGWSDIRYRNLKVCPNCRAPVSREDKTIRCYHGTTAEKAESILKNGFKPDTWFAKHIEDALSVGGTIIIGVNFDRDKVPISSWQFHTHSPINERGITMILDIKLISPRPME